LDLKTEALFTKLSEELKKVNEKLDSLIGLNEKMLTTQQESLRVQRGKSRAQALDFELAPINLFTMPMSLRKTAMALYKLEKATADDIAKQTQRQRAVESASANQLVRLGYARKKQVGRNVYFYLEPPLEMEK
jgi:hypothetical protein